MQLGKQSLFVTIVVALFSILFVAGVVLGQSVASGTIEGTVVDPSGAAVVGATAEIRHPITGFEQTAVTDSAGTFRFTNIPFNQYHIEVTQPGFAAAAQDVNVRTKFLFP